MGFIRDTINSIWRFGLPFSVLIYVALGYFFLWLSHKDNDTILAIDYIFKLNASRVHLAKDTCQMVGTAIIISGVASSLLKTNFFTNILQKQLFNAVYTDEILKNRKDITEVWSKVSKVLYSYKFPDIADSINETITKKYFPIEKHYYYHKAQDSIRIEIEDKEKKIIKTSTTVSGVIKIHRNMISKYNPFDLKNKITVEGTISKFIPADDVTKVEVTPGIFNGQSVPGEFKDEHKDDKYVYAFTFDLRQVPGDSISFEYTVIKRYYMKNNMDFLSRIGNNIHHDYSLFVNFEPSDMEVRFIDIGTAENWYDINKNCREGVICKRYDNVIFPGQGYCLALQIV